MREFLVCYDYGMGGVWRWLTAPSADAIHETFEDLIVFDTPPEWWTGQADALALHVDIEDATDPFLKLLKRR